MKHNTDCEINFQYGWTQKILYYLSWF